MKHHLVTMESEPGEPTLKQVNIFWFACIFALAQIGQARADVKVSLVDGSGRSVSPANYRYVNYLGHGLFYAQRINPSAPSAITNDGQIIDRDGHPIPVKLPRGVTLNNVFLPETADGQEKSGTLPEGTILGVHAPNGYGLADLHGRLILDPAYRGVGSRRGDLFAVEQGAPSTSFIREPASQLIFNSKTRKCFPIEEDVTSFYLSDQGLHHAMTTRKGKMAFGFLSDYGSWAIEPKFRSALPFTPEGLARVEKTEGNIAEYGYIDKTGRFVSPTYFFASSFNKGQAVAGIYTDRKCLKGVIDSQFKWVLEPKFLDLWATSDGSYVVRETESAPFKIIDRTQTQHFEFPPNISVRNIENSKLFVGERRQERFQLNSPRPFVLMNKSGKIIREIEALSVLPGGTDFVIASILVPGRRPRVDLIDVDGNLACSIHDGSLQFIGEGRFSKFEFSKQFDPAVWHRITPHPHRYEHFANFLSTHELIGMHRETVESLLGRPDVGTRYTLSSGFCGNAWSGFELDFEHDKVRAWRRCWSDGAGEWITTNVFADPTDGTLRNLIPR